MEGPYLDKVVRFLVPRSKVSFLVPRSGSSFLVPVPRSSFRFLVPVPRSGSAFRVLTYRFITPSPPSEKEALLTLGIIYTIFFLNVGPGNAGPKFRNSLNLTSIRGVARKKNENHYHTQGTLYGLPGTASFLSCVPLCFGNP